MLVIVYWLFLEGAYLDISIVMIFMKFSILHAGYRKAITQHDVDISQQKEELMQEFKSLHSQMYELKRVHENYSRQVVEKDAFIERLKETRRSLDEEIDRLAHENQHLRECNDKLNHDNTDLRTELSTVRNQCSQFEVQLENSTKQRNYFKDQIEVLTQTTAKRKDEHTRIESQIREYQRRMDSMQRDLSNKDIMCKQLKNKITTLENEFEGCRQELNTCIVTRDSLQQQKLDVERELRVRNISYFHFVFFILHIFIWGHIIR